MSDETTQPAAAVPDFMKASGDIFNEENEVKSAWVKFNKIGDYFVGTLLGVREVPNRLPGKEGTLTKVYEFRAHEGEFHNLDSNKQIMEKSVKISANEVWTVGGKEVIDNQMRNVVLGTIVGMKFTESKPSKTKGFNDLKIIKVYAGKMDPEYNGASSLDTMNLKRPL